MKLILRILIGLLSLHSFIFCAQKTGMVIEEKIPSHNDDLEMRRLATILACGLIGASKIIDCIDGVPLSELPTHATQALIVLHQNCRNLSPKNIQALQHHLIKLGGCPPSSSPTEKRECLVRQSFIADLINEKKPTSVDAIKSIWGQCLGACACAKATNVLKLIHVETPLDKLPTQATLALGVLLNQYKQLPQHTIKKIVRYLFLLGADLDAIHIELL